MVMMAVSVVIVMMLMIALFLVMLLVTALFLVMVLVMALFIVMMLMMALFLVMLLMMALFIVMVLVMAMLFGSCFLGEASELLLQGISLLDGGEDLLSAQIVPVGRNDRDVGVLSEERDRLLHFGMIGGVREDDAACVFHLIEVSTARMPSESLPTPEGSMTIRSGAYCAATSLSAFAKSPTSVQQIQPEFISVMRMPASCKKPPSTPISPNSFSMRTICSPR